MDLGTKEDLMKKWCENPAIEFNPIRTDELPQIRKTIKETADRIFANYYELQAIIERHEATIQKRWSKKSNMKRRSVLLGAWPQMASDHRPDVELVRRKKPGQIFTGVERDAFLMPFINLQDLSKTEPLLLMLNSRARNPPHTFAHLDLQPSLFGIIRGAIAMTRYLAGFAMEFTAQTPYGQMAEKTEPYTVSLTGIDCRIQCGRCLAEDGLLILEVQDRIYQLLVKVCQSILHDIPSQALAGPKYSVLPEPSLPSANSREDGVVSLAVTNLEASYLAPGKADFSRIEKLIDARASESEDALWALREDPQSFATALSEFIAHRAEFMPDHKGELHPVTTASGFRALLDVGPADLGPSNINNFRDLMASVCLSSACIKAHFWNDLRNKVRRVVELKSLQFDRQNIGPGSGLPPEFAMAMYLLFSVLSGKISEQIMILETTALPSHPLRAYFARASLDTIDKFVRVGCPPPHIQQFINLLHSIIIADKYKLIGHLPGVQSLMDEYEKMSHNPENLEAVSRLVADEISTLSLLSECLRQLHLFQPWVSLFPKEMKEPHVLEALKKDCAIHNDTVRQYQGYFMSGSLCTAAWEIASMPYPINKRRTEANVAAMRAAEEALDAFWVENLACMVRKGALPPSCERVLLGRQPSRTPEWCGKAAQQKDDKVKVNANTSPNIHDFSQLFKGLDIAEGKSIILARPDKTKPKTRGRAKPNVSGPTIDLQASGPESDGGRVSKKVDRRSLKVFRTLFFAPSASANPGEVPWKDFLHAMHNVGFAIEKLQGSVWQFTPPQPGAEANENSRSILFHEPHPYSKIPYWDARRIGRRLLRAYGWTGEMFVLDKDEA